MTKRLFAAGIAVLMIGLTTAVARAGLRSEHSGWVWAAAEPQGETLNDVSAAGGTAYAVGDGGALLRRTVTSDWSVVPDDIQTNLTLVDTLSPTELVVSDGCRLLKSTNSGASFRVLTWSATTCSTHCRLGWCP